MKVEKDWVTKAGLRAVVVVINRGHRCGYVGVSSSHKYFGVDYDDVNIESVHGGLTFSTDGEVDYPVESDLHWFGFDCAHSCDAPDPSLMSAEYARLHGIFITPLCSDGVIRSLDYCVNECESLAAQLMEVLQ